MTVKFTRYTPETMWVGAGTIAVMERSKNGEYVKYRSVAKKIDLMQTEINKLTEALAHAKLLRK